MITITPQAALAKWHPTMSAFRDRQLEVIDRLLAGRPTLLLMPTGGGKSLTYQIPVLAAGRIGIVVSPLVALMREQAEKLEAMGVSAVSLGGLEPLQASEALRRFRWDQGPGFVFTSPERAETDGYLEHLLRANRSRIGLVAVDEAHCISQWGHDFRPPYKALPGFIDRAFGHSAWPTVLCLTATLDAESQTEVLQDFRMREADVLRSDQMLRQNLDLAFRTYGDTTEKLEALTHELAERRGEKIIVYAHLKRNSTAGTRALSARFHDLGHRCASYDADMPLAERDASIAAFTSGQVDVVFATGAFGMGIDIPDIRGVIHFLLPESLEQYYQEVGRAGRDGGSAFGLLLYTPKNAKVRQDMIGTGRLEGKDVLEVWSRLFASGRADIRSLSPVVDLGGRDDHYALFYAFQRVGAIKVLARGPGRLQAFEPGGPEGVAYLNRLNAATRIGNFAAAFRKLSLEPATAYDSLFDLYGRGEVRLVRSPDNVLLFRLDDLSAAQAEAIATDVNAKIERRLERFSAFKALIEAGAEPTSALRERFAA
jgi:ATP-dependent DNA helicase RecQ